jgi:hypothetical protein
VSIARAPNLKILRLLDWPDVTRDFPNDDVDAAPLPEEYDRTLDNTASCNVHRLHDLHCKNGTSLPLKLLVIGNQRFRDTPTKLGQRIQETKRAICWRIHHMDTPDGSSKPHVCSKLRSTWKV